jgi:plasmid stabilization system protein ParE
MKLVVSLEAAADLERLRVFLADKNPAIAGQAVAALVAAAQCAPHLARPRSAGGMMRRV